jgi:hypothetical protein
MQQGSFSKQVHHRIVGQSRERRCRLHQRMGLSRPAERDLRAKRRTGTP